MINILVQLSKYIIIALMAAYTFSCFSVFTRNYEDEERRVLTRQDVIIFLMQFIAFAVMYLTMEDMRILFIYAALMIVLLAVILFSSAGYVLAKYEFKGKGIIFGFIMVSMMIPAQVMYVPLFQLFVYLHTSHLGFRT